MLVEPAPEQPVAVAVPLIEAEIPAAPVMHVAVDNCRLELAEPIRFDVASATIEPESEAILDRLAAAMNDNPRLRLVIEGHTHNNISTAARSPVVHQWRRLLDAIEAHLVAAGVDERRLSTAFMDDSHPIASNATAEGRARNVRIEFRDADCTDVRRP